MNLSTLVLEMLLSGDIWAIYGVGIHPENLGSSPHLSNGHFRRRVIDEPENPTITPITPSDVDSTKPATTLRRVPSSTISSLPSAETSLPPAPAAKPTPNMDTGLQIGVGIVAGVVLIVILFVTAEACYLRRKKRIEKSLARAFDEVERGVDKGSEERIVLESRVSIIVEGGDQEEESDEEQEIQERGRNGMSLPRRE